MFLKHDKNTKYKWVKTINLDEKVLKTKYN